MLKLNESKIFSYRKQIRTQLVSVKQSKWQKWKIVSSIFKSQICSPISTSPVVDADPWPHSYTYIWMNTSKLRSSKSILCNHSTLDFITHPFLRVSLQFLSGSGLIPHMHAQQYWFLTSWGACFSTLWFFIYFSECACTHFNIYVLQKCKWPFGQLGYLLPSILLLSNHYHTYRRNSGLTTCWDNM